MAKRRQSTVTEQLRKAIAESGMSLYALSRDSGVQYAALHRFATGKQGLRLESVDRLAAVLGLQLTKKGGK